MSNFYNKTSKVNHNGRTIELGSHEEMRFYRHLKRRDDVESFELQVPYELMPGYEIERAGKKKRIQGISYVADFVVTYKDGRTEVIDVKGRDNYQTDVFKLKRKMFESRYKKPLRVMVCLHGNVWTDGEKYEQIQKATPKTTKQAANVRKRKRVTTKTRKRNKRN